MNKRFIGIDKTVTTGQEIPLKPPLALVLTEHLHDTTRGGKVIVLGIDRPQFGIPLFVGSLKHRLQPIRRSLVGTENSKIGRVVDDHIAQP